ncbi:MAG TPA: hypothetical protein PLQ49_02730 [Methanothrix sp.]|nr:hypothetical protein [Methanothrix sp.]
MLFIFFLILSTVTAAAALDPLAINTTSDFDELEALLAREVAGPAQPAGVGTTNPTAEIEPPFIHLIRNESIFLDFENLTGPVTPFPISAESSWNGSFFETLIDEWW